MNALSALLTGATIEAVEVDTFKMRRFDPEEYAEKLRIRLSTGITLEIEGDGDFDMGNFLHMNISC